MQFDHLLVQAIVEDELVGSNSLSAVGAEVTKRDEGRFAQISDQSLDDRVPVPQEYPQSAVQHILWSNALSLQVLQEAANL